MVASPQSPAVIGGAVKVTASADGCDRAQYRFFLIDLTGVGSLVRGWTSAATWVWSTVGAASGKYGIRVDARAAGSAGDREDASATVSYTLTDARRAVRPCAGLALLSSLPSPQRVGTSVTFSATVAGCSTPVYQWWVIGPDGVGALVRDWSASPSYAWASPAGTQPGQYRIQVKGRDAADTATETTGEIAFTLT